MKRFIKQSPSVDALNLPNTFPARDREFIRNLASDLHLQLAWDEYDENDQNVVTFRLPEDTDDDPEALIALDRMIAKYSNMNIFDQDADGFDSREDAKFMARMEDWKRSYYRVNIFSRLFGSHNLICH